MADRAWTIYVCHVCGWVQSEEEDGLCCARCGGPRSMVEAVEVEERNT